ncbi:MAG: trypsin-like peptidase domain-containing protein [Coriobacteriia bacterium]|nr:trypsin-like peptidase domain-containing protein [Coriobacteriia bacterium]
MQNATAEKASGGKGGLKTFLFGFLGALIACLLVFGIMIGTGALKTATVIGGSGNAITATDESSTLAEQVASKCLPSVVSIDVYTQSTSSGYGGLFDYFYGGGSNSNSGELTNTSLGSGVVISTDGYILTNYHVIEGADALKVTVEGTEYDAEIIGSDSSSDVAVIKVSNANGKTFTAIELGDSDNLNIGEWVMSIGSPFGLEQSVATGIVSAVNRSQVYSDSSSNYYGYSTGESTIYTNMIQTDAAINPGNSGGALVDADGKLIGINTLIESYSGNYSGVGFAIPVNYAIALSQQIISGETPSHAQMGISTTTINSSIAQRYGFSVSSGAYVAQVSPGSGAEAAGVKVGDIITSVDGATIESSSDVQLAVRSKNIGDTIAVTVNRSGETLTLQVTLGSDAASTSTTNQGNSNFSWDSLFGNNTN